ncbi:MAG: DUF4956 domain-containing protein [Acidaminobacteraceae bacterium]
MSFQDIFKNSFLDSAASLSVFDMAITMLMSFLVGIFIYQVYKKSYQSVVYTKSFNLSLVMMSMITSLVIMAVTSNVVLSLGMVGALSIVRFRAAIKDPMDIVFMFWSIAGGIVVGAGFYFLAVVGSLCIGLIIYVMNLNITSVTPYLLMVNFSNPDTEGIIMDKLTSTADKFNVKSKAVMRDSIELVIELRIKKEELVLVNAISDFDSVTHAMLVSSTEYSK